jgi:hypothetical protein
MNITTSKTLPVLQLSTSGDANAFVKCWSSLYDYPEYAAYKSTVISRNLSKKDLRLLFSWKNGSGQNSKKERSMLSEFLQHDELINELKKEFDQRKFQKTFGKIPAVWQIFLLHILQPSVYPVFDKNVYRAYRIIENLEAKRLAANQEERIKIFASEYQPFFQEFCLTATGYDHFDVDKALWTFGKVSREFPGLMKNEI